MKQFLLSLLIFISSFFNAALSFAEEVLPMRSSVRQDYSRIVFDWKESVTYKADQSQKGKLVITFSRAAKPDSKGVDLSSMKNLGGMDIQSENPLTISFSIPEDSKIRVFNTGDKVFLDVYNSPSGKTVKRSEVTKADPPAPVKSEEKKIEEVKKSAPETKHPEPAALPKNAVASPPAPVATPEIVRPELSNGATTETAEHKETLENAADQTQHIISVSSASPLNMAAFENLGELWIVSDRTGSSLKPNIQSPDAKIFGGLGTYPIEGGSAYTLNFPQGLSAKSQGGGFTWRLILAEKGKLKENPSIYPVRTVEDKQSRRSGKLIWKMPGAGKIFTTLDPVTGRKLFVVTVNDALQGVPGGMSFTDFDVLPSYIGLVIRPKADDLTVKKTEEGIEVSRPEGLAILPAESVPLQKQSETFLNPKELKKPDLPGFDHSENNKTEENQHGEAEKKSHADPHAINQKDFIPEESNLFNFSEWESGNSKDLNHNEVAILSTVKSKDEIGQVEDLMKLAKMYLSHGFGFESLGFLEFAQQMQPDLKKSSEFRALRGIARAFTNKSEIALTDLLDKNLDDFDEIKIWKSYVLADLGDWKQAAEILPPKINVIYSYPEYISNRLVLSLTEVYLRAGKVPEAEKLLNYAENHKETMNLSERAALDYLGGELLRQKGATDKTVKLWSGLKNSPDDLYRTKAQLALTVLEKEKGTINTQEAINRLEKLRYAWRGDQLEAQVNYWLGKFYFEKHDFVKGLNIMREAAAIAVDSDLGKRIALDMSDIFQSMFFDKKYAEVSVLDAATVFEQFNELTPPGEKGIELTQKLAERLFEADLLERAAALLREQVQHRLQGEEKIRVAVRLGAIELLDKRPDQALVSLGIAENELSKIQDSPSKAARLREIALLKARALSQSKKSTQALAILEGLEPSQDVSRLKGDIAWQQGYWSDAAAALGDALESENISPTRPLTEKQIGMIMNRAIALSLANDRVEVSNIRTRYLDLMLQSDKARQFEVITRPHGKAELADKDTLKNIISEVDLFGDFLESYKQAP